MDSRAGAYGVHKDWQAIRARYLIHGLQSIRTCRARRTKRKEPWIGVEILARTGNNVKPIRENETGKHSSLAGVRNMYRTQTNHSPRNSLREQKHFRPLVKKQPLYNSHIQNTNVRSSGMHKRSMHKITDSSEYSKHRVNHILALLGKHPKGIYPYNMHQYRKYHLNRT